MPRRGRTLLEVIVAAALLVIVISLSLFSIDDSGRVMGFTMQKGKLETDARLVADRLVRLLRQTGAAPGARVLLQEAAPAVDTPGDAYTRVEFRVNRSRVLLPGDPGYAGTPPAPQTFGLDAAWRVDWDYQPPLGGGPAPPNPTQAIGFDWAPGETPNGADDDGDGVVDEGLLYHQLDVADPATRVVLLEGVLPDVSFSLPSGHGTARPDPATSDTAILVHFRVAAATDEGRRARELVNGLDDNGDGRADEHMLVVEIDEVATLRN